MKTKKDRLVTLISLLLICSFGVFLILTNLKQNIMLFYSPSEINATTLDQIKDKKIKIGGLIKPGSIKKLEDHTEFTLTDCRQEMTVHYSGTLPMLFREDQGVIAVGKISQNGFTASELLTKHDENYMPPEVKNKLPNKSKCES